MRQLLLPAAAASLLLVGCEDDDTEFFPPMTITEQLDVLGLTTLKTALEAAELDDDLNAAGPFTLFAPSNAAFASLPAGVLDDLLLPANQAQLIDLLQYHLLGDAQPSLALAGTDSRSTVQGSSLLFNIVDGELRVNEAAVTQNDVAATNGFVHVIDTVLSVPTDLASSLTDRGFDTLVAAAVAAELDDDLATGGPFAVLAPTEDAFGALPAGVLDDLLLPANQQQLIDLLSFHVLLDDVSTTEGVDDEEVATLLGPENLFSVDANGDVRVDGVRLATTNIPCTNGVIHSLEAVLDAPVDVPATAAAGGFDTLVAALVAAELDDDLADPNGPFTVFAPTDAAFDALPAGVLDALLEPANQADLIQVLTYHVVPNDTLTASELSMLASVTTLEGSDIDLDATSGLVLNTTTGVVAADEIALNGLIHAIDEVLLPPGFVPPAIAPLTKDAGDPEGTVGTSGANVGDPTAARAAGPVEDEGRRARGRRGTGKRTLAPTPAFAATLFAVQAELPEPSTLTTLELALPTALPGLPVAAYGLDELGAPVELTLTELAPAGLDGSGLRLVLASAADGEPFSTAVVWVRIF